MLHSPFRYLFYFLSFYRSIISIIYLPRTVHKQLDSIINILLIVGWWIIFSTLVVSCINFKPYYEFFVDLFTLLRSTVLLLLFCSVITRLDHYDEFYLAFKSIISSLIEILGKYNNFSSTLNQRGFKLLRYLGIFTTLNLARIAWLWSIHFFIWCSNTTEEESYLLTIETIQ